MAKDHVYDDVLARAHAAAMLAEHASPIRRSRYLVNSYMELLPQYLADNPDQIPDGPDPAKREDILTMKLPPMSEEAKERRKLKAEAEAKAKAEAAKKPNDKPNHAHAGTVR